MTVRKMLVRAAERRDAAALAAMRHDLWPEGPCEEHAAELEAFFASRAREPEAILVAESEGRLIGFCELSTRAYAEGCRTDQVGYLEGWYVASDLRRQGVGRALVAAAEDWTLRRGYRELASDAEIDNTASVAAHRAVGFEDAGVIRCFRKDLDDGDGARDATSAADPRL